MSKENFKSVMINNNLILFYQPNLKFKSLWCRIIYNKMDNINKSD